MKLVVFDEWELSAVLPVAPMPSSSSIIRWALVLIFTCYFYPSMLDESRQQRLCPLLFSPVTLVYKV
ncbi:hypothetical protein D918_05928 [Trichuris suis]|nr:hypothetical protein D918_05928 [Trichuris suis]